MARETLARELAEIAQDGQNVGTALSMPAIALEWRRALNDISDQSTRK